MWNNHEFVFIMFPLGGFHWWITTIHAILFYPWSGDVDNMYPSVEWFQTQHLLNSFELQMWEPPQTNYISSIAPTHVAVLAGHWAAKLASFFNAEQQLNLAPILLIFVSFNQYCHRGKIFMPLTWHYLAGSRVLELPFCHTTFGDWGVIHCGEVFQRWPSTWTDQNNVS